MISNTLIDPSIQSRANTTTEWLGSDTLCNYEAISSRFPNHYSQHDIEYKFNGHGFRCDEFNMPSEIPIVFLGCSLTEGIGLRQTETWSYLLLEKIRQKTNKNIPYWNLGLCATGIDTQARNLYFLSTILNTKIKFVFSLIPPICRREYKVESNKYRNWVPNWVDSAAPIGTNVNTLFTDSYFSTHQTERSLMTIDSICRQNGAKMCCTSWERAPNNFKSLFDSFPLIDSFQINFQSNDFARDGSHPGPLFHQKLAELYWNHVEKYFVNI
jgi:hypothetical protein